ncbi:MAG: HNH endonuclease [Planctomycetes bacterium]|nr:HNH endonuclease [Planctomycetota bacterium]
MAYILTNGPIHADLVVMHDCDVRSCCNPDHLKAVTQKVNLADMRAKGRAGDCRNFGEKHGRCKLPTGKLDEVKAKYAAKQGSQTALAKEFGISQTHLSRIVRGVSRVQG